MNMKNLTIALIIIWLSVTGCSGLAEPEYSDNSVMDGEEVRVYGQSNSVLYERDYYHCNWGESGQNNGFFMNGQFSCSVGELNEGIQILTNIRKR